MNNMRRSHRGFGSQLECLIPVACVCFAFAIAFPAVAWLKHAHQHGMNPIITSLLALLMIIAALVLSAVILMFSLHWLPYPVAWYAKLSGRRTDPFREILSDYQDKFLPWLVGIFYLSPFLLAAGKWVTQLLGRR